MTKQQPQQLRVPAFRGEWSFLSNFTPCKAILDGMEFPSTEHAYQAAKTSDMELRKKFQLGTAAEAKKRSHSITPRTDWELTKFSVMKELLLQKFAKGTEFGAKLDALKGIEIVELNNWHDNTFGSCCCDKCGNKGRNELGKMLMFIRDSDEKEVSNNSLTSTTSV